MQMQNSGTEMNAPLPIPAFLDRRPLVYSYTFLHTYKNVCPHQAYRRYILKDQPYVETAAMKWGNEVHAAFEGGIDRRGTRHRVL